MTDCQSFKPKNDTKDQTKLFKNADVSSEDILEAINATDLTLYAKRRGIDFYHRYKEDIALFAVRFLC